MIQRIPSETFSQSNKKNNIWFLRHNCTSVTEQMSALYSASKYKDKTLYGIKLYDTNTNGTDNRKDGENAEEKLKAISQFSLQSKLYLLSCHWVLNWQPLTPNNLTQFFKSLPTSQHELEQISIENSCLKFNKNNYSVYYNLLTKSLQLKQNQYFLNSFDKSGKNVALQYNKFYKKITINSIPYTFAEKIRFVESCQNMGAVATDNYIYIFSLKMISFSNSINKFQIKQCIDMKWCDKGLYYLTSSGIVGLIQKQRTFLDHFNKINMSISSEIQVNNQQYTCMRIIVYNRDMLVGLFFHNSFPENIVLQVLNHRYNGRLSNDCLKFVLKNYHGELLYTNAINCGGFINVIVCTGQNGKIKEINQYIFGAQ